MVKTGLKTEEVRPFNQVANIQRGDKIIFKSSSDQVQVMVTGVSSYKSLDYMLGKIDISRMLPSGDLNEARRLWNEFYPDHQGKIGVISFKLEDDNTRN